MKIYTYEEAYNTSLEYFKGNDLATSVFVDKYALRNEKGEILEDTPDKTHYRIAKEFARIEKDKFKDPLSEDEIYELLKDFKYFVPGGSLLCNIGNNYTYQSLGNCWCLPNPYDSYGGILYTDQQIVQLAKRRGGVGVCIDNIRPKGFPTKNAANTTDGITVFMERFSNSIKEVAIQGRRGALLIGLSIHHPEIETFINIKRNLTKITGANISILITNEFMNAVKNNIEYELRWPVINNKPIISKMINAQYIWNQIIDSNWYCAEPGLLFIDTARQYSLSHNYGKIDKRFYDNITNPCAEVWSGEDSCRLSSINLTSFISDPFTKHTKFNFDNFNKVIQISQRLMDDVVDLEIEKMDKIIDKIHIDPEPHYIKQIELNTWKNYKDTAILGRRTGLGITGLGDTIAMMNLKYGSKISIKLVEDIYQCLAINSMISSCNMAKELGTFSLYDKEIEKNNLFLQNLFNISKEVEDLHKNYGRRNISLTTTAPNGSLSILTQTTSGIEPLFELSHIRRKKINPNDQNTRVDFIDKNEDKWQEYKVLHPQLKKWTEITGETDIEKSPWFRNCAHNISGIDRVEIQAVAQKYITHSISSTVNLEKNISKKEINDIYLNAFDKQCKGITIYRDGSRSGVLIQDKSLPKERPRELKCDVHHITVINQHYIVLVGLFDGRPYEIFACKNGIIPKNIKSGKIIKKRRDFYKAEFIDDYELSPITQSTSEIEECVTRLVSALLRHNVEMQFIVQQLEKVGERQTELHSFAKSVARALKKYIPEGVKEEGICEECGSNSLIREGGCITCKACSFSKCQ